MLPFPGKPTPDGEFTMVYLDVNQRNTVLQQWCAGFGLPKSGNKAQMVTCLHAFSGDSSRWDSTKAHLKPKQSTLRHNRLFEEAGSSSRLLSVLPTDDTFDNQTMEEKNGILAWAARFKAKNPYHPPNHPLRQVTRVGHGASAPAAPSSGGAIVHVHEDIQHIKDSLALVTSCLNLLPSSSPSSSSSSPSTPPLPVLPIVSDVPAPSSKSFTLTLGNGTRLSFTVDDVPEPSFLSFAKDLESLPPIWSDMSPLWEPSKAPFSIHGHPIALVHWRELYHCKPHQWNRLKKRWHERKMIAEHWLGTTPALFWAEFTNPKGERLSYTAILSELQRLLMHGMAQTFLISSHMRSMGRLMCLANRLPLQSSFVTWGRHSVPHM
ncbi:hypothetical protein BDN71DRAFT_1473717 [Pleurotus eryngii]|uniref:SAP domain-containing protein n=1 Tax=Pleurotus eryngii TaxID=5323 RepID=A0A9P6D640_PLEER|nr:hypothetical protein BDN71DRAFT_1473717 [Pleurotus eryngii]